MTPARRSSGWLFWPLLCLGLFGALVLWRWEILTFPPYEDFAIGIFREAQFLERTNFDYGGLVAEPLGDEGGSKSYVSSLIPAALALFMRHGPTEIRLRLMVLHLGYLAVSTGVLTLVYAILAPRVGRLPAALASACVVTTPLFSVQVDQLGADVPLAFFSLLTACCVSRERLVLAGLCGLLAFLMKASGAILLMSTSAYLGLSLLLDPPLASPKRRRAVGLAVNLAALSLALFVQRLADRPIRHIHQEMGIIHGYWGQCPDVLVLGAIACVGGLGRLFWLWRRALTTQPGKIASSPRALGSVLFAEPVLLYGGIVLIGTWLSIALYVITYAPRYLTMAVPFLYLAIVTLLFAKPDWRRFGVACLGLVILLNIVNADGRVFRLVTGSNDEPRERRLERSRGEYLADHRARIAACRALETRSGNLKIVCARPFADYLDEPSLGYVKRPLRGYAVNAFEWPGFLPAERILADLPRELIFVWVDSSWQAHGSITIPAPAPDDEIIFTDGQPRPLVAYRRRVPENLTAKSELEDWHLNQLWLADAAERPPYISIADRARGLADAGNGPAASRLLSRYLEERPDDAESHAMLARLSYLLNNIPLASDEADKAIEIDPRNQSALLTQATVALARGDASRAVSRLEQALAINSESADAHYLLGLAYNKLKKHAEACDELRLAVETRPGHADCHNQLGLALLELSKPNEAAQEFREALRLDPKSRDAQYNLRRTEARAISK